MAEKVEIGFDIEKAKKNIDTYSRATGVECFIINSKGNFLYKSNGGSNFCNFCNNIRTTINSLSSCSSVFLYGSYQAERFGGKYIFFCPLGLVHWVSPISINNSLHGALIGGPALMIDPEEFLLEDLIRKNGIDDVQLMELRKYAENLPIIQPEIVNSLSELLLIIATGISDNSASRYEERREYHLLHAEISQVIQDIKLSKDTNSRNNYPFEKEKELLTKIALGDKHASQRILNEILGYVFFSSGKDFEVIKERVLELIVLLSRAALEGGANPEEIFGLNHRYLFDIHKLTTEEELAFWLSKIMARFTDCVFNLADIRHKDIIYKAIDYIKRNYMNRITLEEVANHVHLNPSYFSKIFKNEMKCNFTSYLNKVRINAGKNLLLDRSIPLTEVSSLIGFEDQSYFTKVFKRETGITPGKFRQFRGKYVSETNR